MTRRDEYWRPSTIGSLKALGQRICAPPAASSRRFHHSFHRPAFCELVAHISACSQEAITRMRIASLAGNASAQTAYQRAGYEPYEIVFEKRIGSGPTP